MPRDPQVMRFEPSVEITRLSERQTATNLDAMWTDHKRFQARLVAEHGVTRVLAGSASLEDAAPAILEAICSSLELQLGELWLLNAAAEELHRTVSYRNSTSPHIESFDDVSQQYTFARAVGLPGRVWEKLAPVWVAELASESNFPRAQVAIEAGLHSAMAFPILIAQDFIGVIEFYAAESREPDVATLDMMAAIGSEIGQFVQRRRAEWQLRRSKEELADFIENAMVGLHRVGPDGRILWANQAELDLLGYTRDEYIGHHISQFHADAAVIEDILRRLGNREILRDYEARLQCKDGSIKHVLINSNVYSENGKFVHTRCFTRDITQRRRYEDSLRFLVQASEVLSSSLDYQSTLSRVAQLAVPHLADWCSVHVIADDGALEQVAAAHVDPAKVELAHEFQRRYPPDVNAPFGVPAVLLNSRPEIVSEIPDSLLVQAAADERHLAVLRELGLRSYLCVPLIARGRTLGVLTFVSAESGRRYQQSDIPFAEDLARRAALAVDNARLYRAAQDEIAERSRAAEQLRESQEQLRFTLEAAQVGTWNWDVQSGKVRWSDDMEAIHGLAPGSFDGTFEAFRRDVHPDDRALVEQTIARAVADGTDYRVEYRLAGHDGRERWVEGKGHALYDESGRPAQMAGICMDVTKRKLAEEKFRLVVEASPSAVVMVDQHGRIALVNTQTERMFGYHRDELIGQSVEVLVPQRFRDNHPMYRAGFLQQPRVRSMGAGRDLFAVRKDGSEFPVEIGLNPIESSEGLFVLSAILDISERKRAEQALKKTNEELEQKNREMEQFVYTVSHDLKSPLVTMMGFVGLLLEDLKAGRHEETIESAERIQRGAQRMSEMINDLLQLSRVGRVQNELEWVDVTALVHEIGADLAERMGEAGVVLRIQEEMPRVMADRTRLGEVFENLLTNAIKYAASGDAPQIVVGSVTMPGQIRFFVRDNGPGIEPKYHNRIFGLFQRLNTNQEGTGMGLTIVARIMQAHGGRCWVESTLGTGATFWLALPA